MKVKRIEGIKRTSAYINIIFDDDYSAIFIEHTSARNTPKKDVELVKKNILTMILF